MTPYQRAYLKRQLSNHALAIGIAVLMAIAKGVTLTWHDLWLIIIAEAVIQLKQWQSTLDLKAPSKVDPWQDQ